MKPATPRTMNNPITATGTAHSGSASRWNPWSSSGFIMAASRGSVAAPMMAPIAAATNAQRVSEKYGHMARTRASVGFEED